MKTGVLLILALLIGQTQTALGEPPTVCAACGDPLGRGSFMMESPYFSATQPICPICAQTKTRCANCLLPVRTNFITLSDGRLLCERDSREAVLSKEKAEEIFDDVKRSVARMLSGIGTIPDKNIRISLVDRTGMDYQRRRAIYPTPGGAVLGLTLSHERAPGAMEHEIYLLTGLRRSRLQAISAHEYAHAWMWENCRDDKRFLLTETKEGFCELVAYNLMSEFNQPFETQKILKNQYTSGQFQALLKGQEKYRFYALTRWMKNGADIQLNPDNLNRILVLKDVPEVPLGWAPQVQTPVPDRLVLKSISGQPDRRFALLNDQTLAKGDRAKVRVGNTSVAVHCLEIREKSIVVQIGESTNPTELFLETPGK